MRMSLGLEQKLVQKQILAPRMIQSMEILQLPIQALQERIEQEMTENPILETTEEETEESQETPEKESPDSPSEGEKELVVDEKDNADDFERLLEMDQEIPDHFDERPRPSVNRMQEDSDRKHDALANLVSRPETLHDILEVQLRELDVDIELRRMCERIISSLDGNGYLTSSLQDLLPPDADEDDLEVARQALTIVQSLEPAGVGARDLRECLLLQLTPEMPFHDELKTLISNHLQDP